MSRVRFELAASSGAARAGVLHSRFGEVLTPAFMPVGTWGHGRHLSLTELGASAKLALANTYHLMLRPGFDAVRQLGGLHRFSGWSGGLLTDSGGFQVFSLAADRVVSEEGVRFSHPFDAEPVSLTPESAVQGQAMLGSDIAMALDVCISSTAKEADVREAMERTHRWALRSLAERDKSEALSVGRGRADATRPPGEGLPPSHAESSLFGIVQGGVSETLRTESAGVISELPFDGLAIGGLAVGEAPELRHAIAAHTAARLPPGRVRYLMGVGTPLDLLECVRAGIDLFDCILPTRMADQGYAYTFDGLLRLSRTAHRLEDVPLEAGCDCTTCAKYSRAFLQHVTAVQSPLSARLLSIHNLRHYARLMERLRAAIIEGRFEDEYRALKPRLHAAGERTDGDFELITLSSGARAVRQTKHGEVMHPGVGPEEEAARLYLRQPLGLGLEAKQGPLKVLDVGLGAAANAATWLSWAAKGARELELVSLEKNRSPLKLALADPEGFAFLGPWVDAANELLRTGRYEQGRIRWRLLEGDARETVRDAGEGFDLVMQDPFSPETEPEMWGPKWFEALRKRCGERAWLATYSSATPVRVGLLLAGWFVAAGVGSGARAETTIAATSRDGLPTPLGERWLTRWKRSSARAPIGGTLTPEVEQGILGHPQFK
ncbi:MAG: tRNA-guanine transglycosylase [Myxococcaceae bacterium]